jgi:hypothetical protein
MAGSDPSGAPAPGGRRRPTWAGDFVTSWPAGPCRLRVDAPFAKARWQPRQAATFTTPLFPGTAVEVDGRLYEIARAESLAGRHTYDLIDWADDLPIRQALRYDQASAEAELAAHDAAQRTTAARGTLALLAPLAGLLPAEQQLRLESAYGVAATSLTARSALPLLVVAVPLEILGIAAQMAGGFGASSASIAFAARFLPLSTYVVLESSLRLASAKIAGEPLGSLAVTLPLAIVRMLRARWRGEPLTAASATTSHGGSPALRMPRPRSVELDRVRPLSGGDEGDLEVVSVLPKDHWTLRTLIWVGDASYVLDRREAAVTEAGAPRHRFVLRRAEPEQVFNSVAHYRPDEVLGLAREARRRERQTWVETFAQLWGLLDAELQAELAAVYGYDAERNTVWSIGGVGALAVAATALALGYLARGGGPADAAMLLAGVYFGWETAERARAWRRGRIVGSKLGRLVRPFARRLLVF